MADVYISYAPEDQQFVRRLQDALEEHNRTTWIAGNIPLTAKWMEEVFYGIDSAASFAFVISPDSVHSRICMEELRRAVKNNKRLIPIWHRNVDDEDVPPDLAAVQWAYFRQNDDFEDSLERLLEALDTDMEWVHDHTRLLVRAKEWETKSHDSSLLLRGSELREAEEWQARAAQKEPKPTPLQSEYILASRQAETKLQRSLRGAGALMLMVGIVLGLVAYALLQNQPFTLLVLPFGLGFGLGLFVGAGVVGMAGILFGYRSAAVASSELQVSRAKLPPERPDVLTPETIFISYSRKDWDRFVKPLVTALRQEGFNVWVDQDFVPGGANWRREIGKALETCRCMVVCVSPDSMESHYVQDEYAFFATRQKPLFPLLCRETELPWDLANKQYVAYRDHVTLINLLSEHITEAA
jgi:hypothetical protein